MSGHVDADGVYWIGGIAPDLSHELRRERPMSETKRYVVTIPSCSCDANSAYVDLTDDERAVLDRVHKAFGRWGSPMFFAPVEEAGEHDIEQAERTARWNAVSASQEVTP
jgi:hypothetical protein